MSVVEYEKQDHIVIIRMNRPERLNAMGRELLIGLAEAWCRYRDDDDAWVAILTGVGRSFCAGEDLKESAERGSPGLAEIPVRDPFWYGELDKPTIAAVNGYAIGGGYIMASRADLRVAAESATFQIAEIVHGLIGGYTFGFNQGFPLAVATELSLAFTISARRAYEIGFVNRVVPDDQLMPAALEMANHLLRLPPLSLQAMIKVIHRARPRIPEEALKLGSELGRAVATTEDVMEARRAFAEKRPPVFRGR